MKTISEIIKAEADECSKSSDDMRNTPQHREIFYVVSIVLKGIADKLTSAETTQPQEK